MRTGKMLGMSWDNMKKRKTRTSLTTLGVVIGIMAIIGLASLGEGFRMSIRDQLRLGFELNDITVIPGSLFAGYNREGFNDQQIQNITTIPGVETATGVMQIGNVTLYNGDKQTTAFVATAVNFSEFLKVFPDRFTYESGSNPESGSNDTVIIGYRVNHSNDTSEPFAQANDNITVTLTIPSQLGITNTNETFLVGGTLRKQGSSGITNFDYWVFLPLSTVRKIYNANQSDLIFVRVTDPQNSEKIGNQIEEKLGQFKVTLLIPLAFIKQVDNILNIVQIFLLAVASISLIVAGIGIMNITMVSVMERTREIGILKAIGAKNRTVLAMFLTEALITGILGGLIGIIAGYGLSYALAIGLGSMIQTQQTTLIETPDAPTKLAITPLFSPEYTVMAFAFALIISVIFGLYPAMKAARLDTVDALHYE